MDHNMELTTEVVKHQHLFRDHQYDIGIVERVRFGNFCQLLFNQAHRVVTEAAHQSPRKAREAFALRHIKLLTICLYPA